MSPSRYSCHTEEGPRNSESAAVGFGEGPPPPRSVRPDFLTLPSPHSTPPAPRDKHPHHCPFSSRRFPEPSDSRFYSFGSSQPSISIADATRNRLIPRFRTVYRDAYFIHPSVVYFIIDLACSGLNIGVDFGRPISPLRHDPSDKSLSFLRFVERKLLYLLWYKVIRGVST